MTTETAEDSLSKSDPQRNQLVVSDERSRQYASINDGKRQYSWQYSFKLTVIQLKVRATRVKANSSFGTDLQLEKNLLVGPLYQYCSRTTVFSFLCPSIQDHFDRNLWCLKVKFFAC